MQLPQLKQVVSDNQLQAVRFIESGCSPIVIELSYIKNATPHTELLKKDDQVLTCKCLEQAYCICREAGIHRAELIQIFTHEEAGSGFSHGPVNNSMPLTF